MGNPHDEYYLAINHHTEILLDLTQARTQLAELSQTGQASTTAVQTLQAKIKRLRMLALASQRAVAVKEEALGNV